jgi:hypothetical protein
MSKEYVRVSLRLPKDEYVALEEYAKKKKITVTDSFRRSVGLLVYITNILAESKLLLNDKRGKNTRIREIVFPW